jgi:hypothetical protein
MSSGGSHDASAGEASSLGGDSAGGDSTAIIDDAGRPTPVASICSQTATWSGATKVANLSTTADEILLSLTPDELDLAFLRSGALYVAHRADPLGNFSAGAVIAIPAGWSATQGAALSADGKRLVLVSLDQTALGEMTRLSRDAVFSGTADESAFVSVNQTSIYSGNVYAAPALSPDDEQLYLNSRSPGGASTVVASIRTSSGPWSPPDRVSSALDAAANARRLPTGVSADERTLFYFNEETMAEEARWRDEPTLASPLYDKVDLGMRRGANPNSACDRLYSGATGDVFVERD